MTQPMGLDQTISRRSLFSALGLLPALRLLGGQQQGAQQQDKPTFSSGVKVVNLYANVRNKAGAIVKDLTKDDFLLDEDGRAQVIGYFAFRRSPERVRPARFSQRYAK